MADESTRDDIIRLESAIDRYWDAMADGRLVAPDSHRDLDVRLAMLFFIYRGGQPTVVPPAQETPTAPATGDWPALRGNAGRTGATD